MKIKKLERYIEYAISADNRKVAKYTRKAIERHLRDLEKQRTEEFPYYFDEREAQRVIDFVEVLKHYQGEFAGRPIVLEPWQVFIISMIYGWRRVSDGRRRFKKAFVYIARKNGKTILASALQLYEMLSEQGAEVYSIATQRKQAEIAFNNCRQFVLQNPDLSSIISIYKKALVYEPAASKIEALSSEYNKFDGFNPQMVLADEVSAHPNTRLIDVMQSGMSARSAPLLLEITTANHNLQNPGRYDWERSRHILDDKFQDETFFAVLYELDEGDDWTDPELFIKANPNIDISLSRKNLEDDMREALQQPQKQTEFKTKHLNLWLNSGVTEGWIPAEKWQRCNRPDFDPGDLSKITAVGAIDLSTRVDWTAYSIYFLLDPVERTFFAEHKFFIPEGQIEEKMKQDSELVRHWIEQGIVTATHGEIVDYQYVEDAVLRDIQRYSGLREIVYDRWSATDLVNRLKDIAVMVEMDMGVKAFSEPAKLWEADVLGGRIIDPNPVIAWMNDCISIYTDFNGNIKPIKPETKKSSKRIDGIITSIMAHSRLSAINRPKRKPKFSPGSLVY